MRFPRAPRVPTPSRPARRRAPNRTPRARTRAPRGATRARARRAPSRLSARVAAARLRRAWRATTCCANLPPARRRGRFCATSPARRCARAGNHRCNRLCCPLASLAMTAKKGKRRVAAVEDSQGIGEEQGGLHECDLVCGKLLSCGNHRCERREHRLGCPPCLQSSFEEVSNGTSSVRYCRC